MLFALVAVLWYAADQLTKVLAVAGLSDRDVSLAGGALSLHLVRNPGAAFSTGTQYTVLLTCFAMVATVAILWVARRVGSVVWALALGLLLGGVAGNLTDRLLRSPAPLRGHVIDFLQLPHWPVFNLADIGINAAAALILLQAYRGARLDGSRERDGEEPTGPGDAGGPSATSGSESST